MEDKKFVEREWNEEIDGHLDEDGFFITPNGSFWDPDYVYFNREGLDKHGGKYDEKGEYIPGPGWDEELNCYESEKEDEGLKDSEEDYENDINCNEEDMMKELAGFDDDDDLLEGKILTKLDPNIEVIVQHDTGYEEEGDYEEENNENNEDGNNNKEIKEEQKEENNNDKKEDDKKEEKKERVFIVKTKDNDEFKIVGNDEDDKKEKKDNYNNNHHHKNHNNNYNNHYKGKNNNYNNKHYGNNKNYDNKPKFQKFNNFDD